ncbi:hypothetical protein [Streptomyces sp. NBC_00989]|uniref:hypothetical protein n=1 Tax=Streptomyces sp. NBC_00989 TaxID=2903705 RepID=UPI002F90B8D4|nr:hypothetical protein OG714_54915 [Streptomyces sp. NBC_00989]
MAAVDASSVGAGVGVAAIALSVSLQMIARKGGGGGGKGHGKEHGGGGGKLGKVWAVMENPVLHIVLWITGGVGMVGTGMGAWVNSVVTWANTEVSGLLTPWVGLGLAWLVSLALIVMLIKDIRGNRAGPRTLGLAATSPFAVVAIPGSVGAGLATAITFVSSLVGGVVGWAFGLR